MSQVITCPACRKPLRIPESAVGKQVRCPLCSAVIRVPAAPAAPPVEAIAPSPPVSSRLVAQPAISRAQPNDKGARTPQQSPAPESDFEEDQETGSRRDFSPVKFKVRVTKDDEGKLKGVFDAEWSAEELRLRQKTRTALRVPAGTPAGFIKGNRLYVEIEDRRIEMAIHGMMLYPQRLARDLAAFLNGKRRKPDTSYTIPWYLLVPALLPIGIPFISMGGALWGALGAGLCGACLAIIRVEKIPAVVRILLSLLLTAFGYGALVVVLLVGGLIQLFNKAAQNVQPNPAPVAAPFPQPAPRPGNPNPPIRAIDPPKPPEPLRGQDRVIKVGETVLYLEFAPDSKLLAAVTHRQTLKLWEMASGNERFSLQHQGSGGNIGLLLFSPDSKWWTAWDGRGPIEVRDSTGGVRTRLDAGMGPFFFSYGSFSPDSSMLAVAAGERVRFWEVPSGTEPPLLQKMIHTPGANYTSAQFTPDGKTLLTGATQNTPRGMERLDQVWDLKEGKQLGPALKGYQGESGYSRLRLSPDGRLALTSTTRSATLLDWKEDRIVRQIQAPAGDFTSVVFAGDSQHLVTFSADGAVTRWNIATGKPVASFRTGSGQGAGAMAVSSDGKHVATMQNTDLTLWDREKAFQPAR